MSDKSIGIAIVGCGAISRAYAGSLKSRPDLVRMVGAYDVHEQSASAFCQEFECRQYAALEAALADDEVGLVVNLTAQQAHADITLQSVRAAKHVFSEKPLALNRKDAFLLVEAAEEEGVRLSCAPFTWMGEAQQTAWKTIREGRLGEVRVVYAEMNWARIETWHPAPQNFYRAGVGPLPDVGVYPLAILTTILGPVERVWGFGRTVLPRRCTREGESFAVESPDIIVGGLEFACGALGRLTSSFYVGSSTQQGIEFHGDKGAIHLASCPDFASPVRFCTFPPDPGWVDLPYIKEPFKGVEWGRAIFDLLEAIAAGRPHRATGSHAAHVVDICCSITESAECERPVQVMSTFDPPEPMDWAV